MQEFFVANNRVDIARNQIIREGQVIALEPKVLEVLKVLAQHQGEVVSHQTLLDCVWPDIVVAPNALQRCIGQLRKALNDDGKTQRVIATHPKKGYSLLAPVSVRCGAPTKSSGAPTKSSGAPTKSSEAPFDSIEAPYSNINESTSLKTVRNPLVLWCSFITALLIIVGVLLFGEHRESVTPLQKFTRLTPLTATDASEFYSTFSPDGRYVAFSRKVSGVMAHMWLLDRESGREIQLTKIPGSYGKPTWSTDGNHIAFLETQTCGNSCLTKGCEDINVIFLPLALNEPQPANKIRECAAIPFLGLEWIDNRHLAVIVNDNNTSAIVKVNAQTGETKTLLETHETSLYSLSWSPVKQLLAVMQVEHEKSPSMFLFSPEKQEISQQKFTPPERYNSNVRWTPVWDQTGDHFLFSASSYLYLMDLQGNLHSQIIPTFEDISYPMFHPTGNSIAMTLGKIDTDIAELELSSQHSSTQDISFNETPFARSILRESYAQYQPGGDKIAFFSKRAGNRQIWLTENNQDSQLNNTIFQLSHIEDVFPEHFVWSPGGQQIAVSTEHQLIFLDLQEKIQSQELPFRITHLYQWLVGDDLLMQIVDSDGPKLVRYHIASNHYTTVQQTQSYWAQADAENVWFTDTDNHIKKHSQGQSSMVSATSELIPGARFFLRGQQLFILSHEDDVWCFDVSTEKLTRLFHYPNTTVHLTDVSEDGQRMLISKQLSAKKEIVLLTP